MKSKFLLLLSIGVILLWSCKNDSENTFKEFTTSMKVNIPLITENNSVLKASTSSSKLDYNFSGENTYELSDLSKDQNESSFIKNIEYINGAMLSIPIQDNVMFSQLNLGWGYKSSGAEFIMQNSFDLLALESHIENGEYVFNLDEVLSQIMNNSESINYASLMFKITGKSDLPFNGIATLDAPLTLKTKNLNIRFELF